MKISNSLKNNYPRYFVSSAYSYTFSVSYWKLLNSSGETMVYRHGSPDPLHYKWSVELWNKWIRDKDVKEIPIEELALII